MPPEQLASLAFLCVMSLVAGVVNSVAGGGTLLTFPALLGVYPPEPEFGTLANGTSKVALLPGSVAGAWGFRRELVENRALVLRLLFPSLLGGVLGTLLVTRLDPRIFKGLVPWLILTATLLLFAQPFVSRWVRKWSGHRPAGRWGPALAVAFQFVVSLYGGYFGAGIGILMLTALGFMGLSDIHHMNGVKNLLASLINGISAVTFVIEGEVDWRYALVMIPASVLGGWLGAHYSRRMPAGLVRWIVVGIGFVLAGYYFSKQMFGAPG